MEEFMTDHITRKSAPSSGGGPELWLVGINAGAALAIAAFVAALTEPADLAAGRAVMWTLVATGVCILSLCVAGYRGQR
jgi:hypothetical protein